MSTEGIGKDSRNAQQGFAFRGIDAVMNALSGPLVDAGLLILPRVMGRTQVERATAKGGVLFYTTLEVEFDFVSAEDGSVHVVRVIGEAMDSADKSSNKAMSAAYKYACLQAFCIPTEGDNDADKTTPGPGAPRAPIARIVTEEEQKEVAAGLTDAAAAEANEDPYAKMLALVTEASTTEILSAMKVAVSKFRTDARWPELKAAYTAAVTRLSGKKE